MADKPKTSLDFGVEPRGSVPDVTVVMYLALEDLEPSLVWVVVVVYGNWDIIRWFKTQTHI